jgi:transposase-like protein
MIPSVFELHDLLFDKEKARQYLISKNIFYETIKCSKCDYDMKKDEKAFRFRCYSKHCRHEISLSTGTFFYGSKLQINKILYLARLWLTGATSSQAKKDTKLSSATIAAFYNYFRSLVATTLDVEDQIIGGDGIIVEVDETKLGKRKYNRGHRVDGTWVVVGVERTSERRIFLIPVENRNSETLSNIIRNHVHDGSIVHTDYWKGYSSLSNDDRIQHRTVNHKEGFKDKSTGVHTNVVEGTNFAIKRQIAIRNRVRNGIEEHLSEFVWRRIHQNSLWDSLITALKDIHFDIV